MSSTVDVACVTTAVTPSTVTMLSPAIALKSTPVMTAACPSTSGFGSIDEIRTGGGVRAASPVIPSEVADTVVLPGVPPVTRPSPSTVAIEASAVSHVIVLPVRALASAARAVAVIWTLRVEMTCTGSGVTSTEATLVNTMMDAEPLCPSEVPVIVAVPGETPVTKPLLLLTVAIAALEVLQATERPVSTVPAASSVLADIWTVVPRTTFGCAAVTVTVATGFGGGGESPPLGSLLFEQPTAKLNNEARRGTAELDDIVSCWLRGSREM